MNLLLSGGVSASDWVESEVYCAVCGSASIERLDGADFRCPACREEFRLKSARGAIGDKVAENAYISTLKGVKRLKNPNYLFLSRGERRVAELYIVPKYFLLPETVTKRPPKGDGRVGCYINYGIIPEQGKVAVVRNGVQINKQEVMRRVCQANALKEDDIAVRGRLFDILNIVNSFENPVFTLEEICAYSDSLKKKHIDCGDIRDMIRDQLQIMRDRGIIEFVASGLYKKVWSFTEK